MREPPRSISPHSTASLSQDFLQQPELEGEFCMPGWNGRVHRQGISWEQRWGVLSMHLMYQGVYRWETFKSMRLWQQLTGTGGAQREVSLVSEVWAPHFDPVGFLSPSVKGWDAMDVTQLVARSLLLWVCPERWMGAGASHPWLTNPPHSWMCRMQSCSPWASVFCAVRSGRLPRRFLRAYTGLSQHLEHYGDHGWI